MVGINFGACGGAAIPVPSVAWGNPTPPIAPPAGVPATKPAGADPAGELAGELAVELVVPAKDAALAAMSRLSNQRRFPLFDVYKRLHGGTQSLQQ